MQHAISEQQGAVLLRLSGEIDLSNSPLARKLILAQLDAGKPLAVDLSGVSYIDSSGIASLVEGYQKARSGNLRFALVAVSEATMKVLQLARLDQVFPLIASMDDFDA
ncbi:MAG: STAS domain-containing protein [Gammaproteobacteria bacterium]|nr:STAS domain-containing protein [Gammaproteobacteria bacterium]